MNPNAAIRRGAALNSSTDRGRRARVCKNGKELRQMGAGESFGEIALLRRVLRTATVIAMSRLQARTLTREEFLGAVTGNAASAADADEVISARLQAG
jgi:CRP-like cAMP-binding protein